MEVIHNFDSEESGTVSYNSKNRGNLDFDDIFDKKPSKINCKYEGEPSQISNTFDAKWNDYT